MILFYLKNSILVLMSSLPQSKMTMVTVSEILDSNYYRTELILHIVVAQNLFVFNKKKIPFLLQYKDLFG